MVTRMDQPEATAPEAQQPSAAVTKDHAVVTQPERAPGVQVIPVATNDKGEGWGLVGLYADDVQSVEVEQDGQSVKGKIEKSAGGEGLTRLDVTGGPANATIQLVVTPTA